ncbi:right-handed parallel beta-helix repeat-containing protein [Streptomyces sp. NBC_00654]|uniref:right-handed parallel beta-helix repeat-containing protein n=1 Tax=Streptomyces sp. NBC_00654 TaxID=2975799 RepID=UPI00225169AF|nr:right-handed parallel beta-helix repeat-containing protein [Streptomyces sp. NBC_00654]MCX4966649.1 right-handed parallel beta-helix repeat-containing protein [Streptomyces sp. NBC_00654]
MSRKWWPRPGKGSWSAAALLASLSVVAAAVPAAALPHKSRAGEVYYVAPSGRDSDKGTRTDRAFQHIQRCADVMEPGDTCLIQSGTYAETVVPARSGTAGLPITYRAAPGAKVTLSGTAPVRGFAPVTGADVAEIAKSDPYAQDSAFSDAVAAGHVYSTSVDLGSDVTTVQVFTDKKANVEAQWPYPGLDLLDPTLQYAGAGSAEATIRDEALTRPAGYWDGARALTGYWYVSATGTVKSSAAGSVTLDAAPPCVHKVVPKETRYALAGKIGELARPGEWFYDPAAKRLYLYSEDSPAAHTIEAKARSLAFDLTAASHTTVAGVGLFASTIRTGPTSTGVTLDGITGTYLSHYTDITRGTTDCGSTVTRGVGDTGIVLDGTYNRIVNSDLSLSAGNGIALRGQNNTATDNVIHDVDYMGTYAAGIAVQGNSQTVTHNTISRVGRSGINLQWNTVEGLTPGKDLIAYNDISGYARLSLDVAAIYTCCSASMMGTSIDHNVLHDPEPATTLTTFGISGVYADNGQSDLVIANNVGWGNREGTVMLNGLGTGSHNNGVYNNTGGMTLFYVKEPGQSTGTKIYNNIGTIRGLAGATDGGLVLSNNLPGETDPLFADPAGNDYRLTADSPARHQAIALPGINDGSTDATPSLGAYQYGAPKWTAGARR